MKNDNHPRWQAGYLLRKYSFPPGVILFFAKKGREETGKGKNLFLKMYFSIFFGFLLRIEKICVECTTDARVSGVRVLCADTPARLSAGAVHDIQSFLT